MRFVILHCYLFKTAGSTVEDILHHSFGDRFGALETPVGGGLISNEEIVRHLDSQPELRAFSSPRIRHPLPQAPGYLFFDICFLRDPLDRLRSFYLSRKRGFESNGTGEHAASVWESDSPPVEPQFGLGRLTTGAAAPRCPRMKFRRSQKQWRAMAGSCRGAA